MHECKICQRDIDSEPEYLRCDRSGPIEDRYAFTPYFGYTVEGERVVERSFWYCYEAFYGDRPSALLTVIKEICLDCFDEVHRKMYRRRLYQQTRDWPTHLENELNLRVVAEIKLARRGKRTVRDAAPITNFRRDAVDRLEFIAHEAKFIRVGTEAWFLRDMENRDLSAHMSEAKWRYGSGATSPASLNVYRARYRHFRKLAGIKGRMCKLYAEKLNPYCPGVIGRSSFESSNREMSDRFTRDKHRARMVEDEFASMVQQLERSGDRCYTQFTFSWLITVTDTQLHEAGVKRTLVPDRGYTQSSPALSSTSAPLSARLKAYKFFKTERTRRQAQLVQQKKDAFLKRAYQKFKPAA